MIVYFEGADGSGKSTLLEKFAKYFKTRFKNVKICRDANKFIPTHPKAVNRLGQKELFERLAEMNTDEQTIYFIDRGPISDIVYRVFDNYSTVTTINKFNEFLKTPRQGLGVMIVYCRTPLSYENMLKRGEDNPTALNHYEELSKVYDIVMNVVSDAYGYCGIFDYSVKGATRRIIKKVEEKLSALFIPEE